MITIRQAIAEDAEQIAAIHTAGWRETYHNVMTPEYLEQEALAERLTHWRVALSTPTEDQAVFVVESENTVAGFICVKLHYDPLHGHYIDSLHISAALRGQGTGKMLLRVAAEWLSHREPQLPVWLWVFEENTRATALYHRLGGSTVETSVSDLPGSDKAPVLRIRWPNAEALLNHV